MHVSTSVTVYQFFCRVSGSDESTMSLKYSAYYIALFPGTTYELVWSLVSRIVGSIRVHPSAIGNGKTPLTAFVLFRFIPLVYYDVITDVCEHAHDRPHLHDGVEEHFDRRARAGMRLQSYKYRISNLTDVRFCTSCCIGYLVPVLVHDELKRSFGFKISAYLRSACRLLCDPLTVQQDALLIFVGACVYKFVP